jgi:hypothetical protein
MPLRVKKELFLYGKDDVLLFAGGIMSLPLQEEFVIKKSVEFFNDDSPCFIHRSAVMKRIYVELEEYLEKGAHSGRNEWSVMELPDLFREVLQKWTGIDKIEYR